MSILKRIFKGADKALPILERTGEIVGVILSIDAVKDAAGDILNRELRAASKQGNNLEFGLAMAKLNKDEHEFICELMDPAITGMTNDEQENFQQKAALTGKAIDDTVVFLRSLIAKADVHAAYKYLKDADYLQPPTTAPKKAADKVSEKVGEAWQAVKTTANGIDADIKATGLPAAIDALNQKLLDRVKKQLS